MGKIKEYLMEVSEQISDLIESPSNLNLKIIDDEYLDVIINIAILKYISKLGIVNIEKAQFVSDNKDYIREFIRDEIKNT